MARKFMTDLQHFEAMSRLKEHLHRVGEDGFAYDPEWSDKRVAEETDREARGQRIRAAHVCQLPRVRGRWSRAEPGMAGRR
jgi:hypothetical protein